MRLEVTARSSLRFDDGAPVRAASAVAPYGDGWLIVQDDVTHAAWRRPGSTTPVRVVDAVDGHEVFSAAAGTKHLKPDFEAACATDAGVLLLGSGSTAARMRASLVTPAGYEVRALAPVYHRVAAALGLDARHLNLEGACLVGAGRMRWFQRGNAAAGVASASVDVDLQALLAGDADGVETESVRRYDLGTVAGVALAITDAVPLADGLVLVSAAAEDTPNAYDDGPVVGAALALLDAAGVRAIAELPEPAKVEGLAVRHAAPGEAELLAVVDADDPDAASAELIIRVRF